MYKQGLRPNIRAELMRTGVAINNVRELYTEIIQLDNRLYKLVLEIKSYNNNRTNRQLNQGKLRNNFVYTRQTTRATGYYTSKDLEPMHLDAIECKE